MCLKINVFLVPFSVLNFQIRISMISNVIYPTVKFVAGFELLCARSISIVRIKIVFVYLFMDLFIAKLVVIYPRFT